MYIGLVVWEIGNRNILGQIEWVKDHGFDEVGIHVSPWLALQNKGIDMRSMQTKDYSMLRKALKGFREINIHAPFHEVFDIYLASPNPDIRKVSVKELASVIKFAGDIGAKTVTIHPDTTSVAVSAKEEEKYLRESIIFLDEAAARHEVLLGVEFSDLSRFALIEKAGLKNTGITLDVGHVNNFNLKSYNKTPVIPEIIKRFADTIYLLHIHDSDGETDHLPLGKGNIDFAGIIRSLEEIGYGGSLSIELSTDRSSIKDILESRNKLKELIKDKKL